MYTYRYGGKKSKPHNLVVSNDRVVVRTRNARPLDDAIKTNEGKKVLSKFDVEVEFPEADVSILKSKKENESETFQENARSVLKTEQDLRFAGRVLMDDTSDDPILYTENIYIKFKEQIKAEVCEQIIKDAGLKIKEKVTFAVNAYFTEAGEGTGLKVFDIANGLLDKKEVESCHPELVTKRTYKSIHPKQWHLKTTTIANRLVNQSANVEAAHAITRGKNIVFSIIDDGVDIDHPEFNLTGKVIHARDIDTNSANPRPVLGGEEGDNHGTACAGVGVASGITASGVAPEATLLPIRNGGTMGNRGEAAAFQWAAEHGADVISCSWGPRDGVWFNPNDPFHFRVAPIPDMVSDAIKFAATNGRNGKGCIIFFAAGNGNERVENDHYASHEMVMAIAACSDTGKRSIYSDFGKGVWCSFPSNDFFHPNLNPIRPLTEGIFTTDRTGSEGYIAGDYAINFGGTSSACPGAAGVAALILSINPELTRTEVKEIMKECCDKIDEIDGRYDVNGHSIFYGHGRLNAEKAVKLAQNTLQVVVSVKIKSALVNPVGIDDGKEIVTLFNAGNIIVDLQGWTLSNKKGKSLTLDSLTFDANETITVMLDKAILTNKADKIILRDSTGKIISEVSYSESEAKKQGKIIEFA
jgi:subtilisin family serine protease